MNFPLTCEPKRRFSLKIGTEAIASGFRGFRIQVSGFKFQVFLALPLSFILYPSILVPLCPRLAEQEMGL